MTERKEPPKENNTKWKKATRTLFFWLLIFMGAIYIVQLFNLRKPREVEVYYPEYRRFLEEEMIQELVIKEDELHGILKFETQIMRNGADVTLKNFKTVLLVVDREMVEEWQGYDFEFRFEKKTTEWWGYVISSVPWLLLIFVYVFFFRRMQGGGGSKGIFSFGKSRAKLLTENTSKVTFEDVAGADEAKQELMEIIDFLKAPDKFRVLGGRIPKGVLLLGPPGTGKTLLAKAVAGEAGVPFMSISGADFVEMFVGVGASRVRDLFDQGKKNAPCIIFIDEMDAVGRHRGAGLGGGHDEREQTLNQLLVEMDGFETNEGVILLAATNRPDVLDHALLRPGRFDRQVVVDLPDVRGREGILKVHTRKIPLGKDIYLDVIAKGTPGFSGADIANLVNEAALLAARRDKKQVDMEDFEDAKDKVMMGVERKSMIISDREKRHTAYHESGHVLVSKLLPNADPVHKVTIIPRGRALGVTSYLPIDERHTYSKKYLETVLAYMLGGRAAELIVLNELSNGAGNDIEKATDLARKMVCEWGMSAKLGPVTFGKKSEEIFIGREIAQHRDYSEHTAVIIDGEVKSIVERAAQRAESLLRKHESTLHKIAKRLLEKEILSGDEIDEIMGRKPVRRKPSPSKKPSGTRKRTSAPAKPKAVPKKTTSSGRKKTGTTGTAKK